MLTFLRPGRPCRARFADRGRGAGPVGAAARLLATGWMMLTIPGCEGVGYVLRQGIGQLGVLLRAVPIDDVLEGGRLEPEAAEKLRLVVEAREFGRARLGLRVGGSFRTYHDTGGRPMAYNLSACRKDALTPKRWWFPVIGWIDYIGYYDERDARAAEQKLKQEGYDTLVREVDAFSSLGWFPDPVHSPLLQRDRPSLVEVVIHELAHNTVYANGQSDFNESLATFVGRTGAVQFYAERGDEATVRLLRERYEDQDRLNAWLIELREALTEYYARDIPSAEKIAGREAVFQDARQRFEQDYLPRFHQPERYRRWASMETNNALVRLNMRYNLRQELFARVYEAGGRDWGALLAALRRAAGSSDPFAELERRSDAAPGE